MYNAFVIHGHGNFGECFEKLDYGLEAFHSDLRYKYRYSQPIRILREKVLVPALLSFFFDVQVV